MSVLPEQKRKSFIEIGEIYFWTATINKWQKLLEDDEYKELIISSLEYLSNYGKSDVFAFVIMPNHIHLIWRVKAMNGKETPIASFIKYTAYEFKKLLRKQRSEKLHLFQVDASNKVYEFWQRDPLAVQLYTKEVAIQKLIYIHSNPVAEHWQLVKDPSDYKYSSATFYELSKSDFPFLKDLYEEFNGS